MSRFLKVTLFLLCAVGLAALLGIVQFNRYLQSPIALAETAIFEVSAGSAFVQVSDELAELGIIEQPAFFQLHAKLSGMASRIQAGEYQIQPGTTPRELLRQFVSGDVRLYSFTIVEGWTFSELLNALANDPVVESTLSEEDWPLLLETITAAEPHPEGLFLPETYRFPKGSSDVDILRQAYDFLQETLADEWAKKSDELPIASPYEALILASIVEKETALAEERPRIAGVFVRRLEQRMRLQTDPTVIYGIGKSFDGNLTRKDLQTDTPYNTYTRSGLPPTPIAMPGRAAINAALHPAAGTEVYFVATGLGDGSHKFSNTKAEHDAAVQEYLRRRRLSLNQVQGQ